MNNFIRPSLYNSDHQIFPVKNKNETQIRGGRTYL